MNCHMWINLVKEENVTHLWDHMPGCVCPPDQVPTWSTDTAVAASGCVSACPSTNTQNTHIDKLQSVQVVGCFTELLAVVISI